MRMGKKNQKGQKASEVVIDEAANIDVPVKLDPTPEAQEVVYEYKIKELADKNSIPVEELVEEYQKQYQDLSQKGVSANLEKLAYNGVLNLVRKKTKPKVDFVPKAKADQVVGFVIGDSGVFDKVLMMVNKAKSYSNKYGIAAAQKAKLINANSEPIDTRDEVFGKPNDDKGKPLGKRDAQGNFVYNHERSRTLDMIAKLPNEENFKLGTIQTNDNQLALGWGKIKFFALASVFGIVKETDEPFALNSSSAEDTRSIFHAVHEDIDIDAIFMQVVGPKLTEIGELPQAYELLPKNPQGKPQWNHRFYVRGTVSWIARDRRSPIGTINMGFWNPETGAEVVVQIPEQLSADFGENSEIIVIGKLSKGDLRVEGEGGKAEYVKGEGPVRIDALGFYKIKGMTTPAESSSPEALEEEAAIDGWME